MAQISLPLKQAGFGKTSRSDLWWVQPLAVFLGLSAFIVYSTWAALQGVHYFAHVDAPSVAIAGGTKSVAQYLSPMYSPVIFDSWKLTQPSGHAWFGPWPGWLPQTLAVIPLTPAFLVLWAPGGFRFTCYYYRGAYYKAFVASPPQCAVGKPWKGYGGENRFPLILQNCHRYFLYLALVFLVILSYDAVLSYWFRDAATGDGGFGIGVGSLVLTINPILLGAYTLGCHSLRHLIGGRHDRISEKPGQHACYRGVSCLNRGHMLWAWLSLLWVGFTDLYVRLTSMGVITDWRLI